MLHYEKQLNCWFSLCLADACKRKLTEEKCIIMITKCIHKSNMKTLLQQFVPLLKTWHQTASFIYVWSAWKGQFFQTWTSFSFSFFNACLRMFWHGVVMGELIMILLCERFYSSHCGVISLREIKSSGWNYIQPKDIPWPRSNIGKCWFAKNFPHGPAIASI